MVALVESLSTGVESAVREGGEGAAKFSLK